MNVSRVTGPGGSALCSHGRLLGRYRQSEGGQRDLNGRFLYFECVRVAPVCALVLTQTRSWTVLWVNGAQSTGGNETSVLGENKHPASEHKHVEPVSSQCLSLPETILFLLSF